MINLKPYDKQPIPEAGKEYHTFDDGKISPSRHSLIKVVEVIPFESCQDKELINTWKNDVEECYWLYSLETDYFVKAEYEPGEGAAYYVRTTDGGWFSIGWWGARLDVTGKLYENMIKYLEEK